MLYCGEEIGTGVDPKVCSLVCYSFNALRYLKDGANPVNTLRRRTVLSSLQLQCMWLLKCFPPPRAPMVVTLQVDIAVDPLDGTTLVSQVRAESLFNRNALPCPALAVHAFIPLASNPHTHPACARSLFT